MWPLGTEMDVYICVSPDAFMCDFSKGLVYEQNNLVFGEWATDEYKEIQIEVTDHLRNNGSFYAHIYLARNKKHPKDYEAQRAMDVVHSVEILTKFHPKRKTETKKNLLTGVEEQVVSTVKQEQDTIISYWYPNLTINYIPDAQKLPVSQLKTLPQLFQYVKLADKSGGKHLPIIYPNTFWMLMEDVYNYPINDTITTLPLIIRLYPLSMWKFQLMVQMDHSFKVQTEMLGQSQTEVDSIKRMFYETNPYFLMITFMVSILHSVFDFLAFKNDVQFWTKQKSYEGLSIRTIMLNIVFQTIIFLYLLDNETSYIIIVSSFIGLIIEAWKIQKAMDISISVYPFQLKFQPKHKNSSNSKENKQTLQEQTDEYDAMAFKYLSILCFPLLIGYTAYSLFYSTHTSWYSFTIQTLVQFVYTFGFIAMTPQLFINYKLKSVAHMPWRTLMYKSLNTIIDDLFAFIIKMPLLHRLACFRDDLVFIVYLYQRWIYPTDNTRPNEYGQVIKAEDGEVEEEEEEEGKKKKKTE